jgi:hypothetical protein
MAAELPSISLQPEQNTMVIFSHFLRLETTMSPRLQIRLLCLMEEDRRE